jgi:hypothetical protein
MVCDMFEAFSSTFILYESTFQSISKAWANWLSHGENGYLKLESLRLP